MGLKVGAYATVWEVKEGKGNYMDARISTSKKNKTTNQYETDFSGYVRFIGDAAKKATSLKERDRIKIGDCELTNRYDKERNTTYTNVAIFDFEQVESNFSGSNSSSIEKSNLDDFMTIPDDVDDELPFN